MEERVNMPQQGRNDNTAIESGANARQKSDKLAIKKGLGR